MTELRKKTGFQEDVIRHCLASLAEHMAFMWDGQIESIKLSKNWRKAEFPIIVA
jgi:hypothetical protein